MYRDAQGQQSSKAEEALPVEEELVVLVVVRGMLGVVDGDGLMVVRTGDERIHINIRDHT